MVWPDLTKRSNAILILLGMDMVFFFSMVMAYALPHATADIRAVTRDAFLATSGPLLLALKMGGPDTPQPPADGGTVQQTTVVTPPEAQP